MRYLRPIPSSDGARLAGGWVRFDRIEVQARGAAPKIVSLGDIGDQELAPLVAPRPNIAGIAMDRPSLMGILNVTPDSFSDGGRHLAVDDAVAQADRMAAADILDIGGESTRPGAPEIDPTKEAERVLPVIDALAGRRLSIDTRKAAVARRAIAAGAKLINDVSGLQFDVEMTTVAVETDTPVCLMHSIGTPATMQDNPHYADVVLDVYDALAARIDRAVQAGIARNRIIADPGIGFGKTEAHNLTLLHHIGLFHGLGVPLLLGASRKGFIGRIGNAPNPDARLPGTLAVTLAAVAQGVQMHRVHDVADVAQGLALWRAVTEG
ncbi:MAG: dihydropteroate synthase [Pseudomonadota bacterium]